MDDAAGTDNAPAREALRGSGPGPLGADDADLRIGLGPDLRAGLGPDSGLQDRAFRVSRALDAAYGRPLWRSRGDPLSELVLTILSQATSDTNSGRAFERLRETWPEWKQVAEAPTGAVADAIRSGGLADQKAPRIQAVLREIAVAEGACSLDRLHGLSTEDGVAYLSRFHGVGPKTVACVMMFSMGRPVLPVDTHVHRVTTRLGLVPPKTTAERAHALLQALIPPYETYAFHVRFIRHGRKICHAQRPECASCPLLEECPEGARRLGLRFDEERESPAFGGYEAGEASP